MLNELTLTCREYTVWAVILVTVVFAQGSSGQQPPYSSVAIRANDNRTSAGSLKDGVLTIHLELTSGDWYPEADGGPNMRVDALAEEGKSPQVPGPLVRVPQGTEIRVTFRNLLPSAAIIHGMHPHPGDAKDVLQVPSGQARNGTS